jgi:hypothetical protein
MYSAYAWLGQRVLVQTYEDAIEKEPERAVREICELLREEAEE